MDADLERHRRRATRLTKRGAQAPVRRTSRAEKPGNDDARLR
jgi:hypothetical protein